MPTLHKQGGLTWCRVGLARIEEPTAFLGESEDLGFISHRTITPPRQRLKRLQIRSCYQR